MWWPRGRPTCRAGPLGMLRFFVARGLWELWTFPVCLHVHTEIKYGVRSPKFIWAPLYSCSHWLRPRNSPPPPLFGLIYEGAIWSAKRDDISLWLPVYTAPVQAQHFRIVYGSITSFESSFPHSNSGLICTMWFRYERQFFLGLSHEISV